MRSRHLFIEARQLDSKTMVYNIFHRYADGRLTGFTDKVEAICWMGRWELNHGTYS